MKTSIDLEIGTKLREVRRRLIRYIRVYLGLGGVTGIVVAIFLIMVTISGFFQNFIAPPDELGYTPPEPFRIILGVLEIWIQILAIAIAVVYFLRLLHWAKRVIEVSWNRETPPFTGEIPPSKPENVTLVTYQKAENKSAKWLGAFAGTFFAFLVLALILSEFSLNINHIESPVDYNQSGINDIVEEMDRILYLLPLVGDLVEFFSVFPGDSLAEKIVLNGLAIPLSVAIRNLMYIFEHPDQTYERLQIFTPSRYYLYLILTFLGSIVVLLFSIDWLFS